MEKKVNTAIIVDHNNNISPPPTKFRKLDSRRSCNIVETIEEPRRKKANSRWAFLPPELLLKIFGHVVELEGSALPSLMNFSKVCSNWRRATLFPEMWTCVKFTPALIKKERNFRKKTAAFEAMATKKLKRLKTLVVAGLPLTTAMITDIVSKKAENLRNVTLARGGKVSYKNCLQTLVTNHGSHLEKIYMEDIEISSADYAKTVTGLGKALKSLTLIIPQLPRLVCATYGHLCNLVVLHIECPAYFELSSLRDLHKLKVVHLIGMELDTKGVMEIEWPELEDFDVPSRHVVRGSVLPWILQHSKNIKNLGFRNREISTSSLQCQLDVGAPLQSVDLSASQDLYDLLPFLVTYNSTLTELTLDRCPVDNHLWVALDETFWKSMKYLSIRGTDITERSLVRVLPHMKKLEMLDLTTCRCLPRGFKRKWKVSELKSFIASRTH